MCQALVDTGATISLVRPGVLPEAVRWEHTTCSIRTVTGGHAEMKGKRLLQVRVGTVKLNHEFWLADIQDSCIIGLDLLTRWGAQVDMAKNTIRLGKEVVSVQQPRDKELEPNMTRKATTTRTIHPRDIADSPQKHCQPPTTHPTTEKQFHIQHPRSPPEPPPNKAAKSPPACSAPPSPTTAQAVHDLWQRSSEGLDSQQSQQLKALLHEFMDIFAALDEECTQTGLVQHVIDTGTAAPVRLRPHRLPLAKREAAERIIQDMAANGIIEPSNSPWAAPVVLVKKKDATWRFCVDYRRLNAVTRRDSYPLPRIDDALDYIAGSRWFSSLDLRSGYWQVELAPEAKPKTAFTIGQGLWQFRVMPFGLCNAPATFERLMEHVLAGIPRNCCVVYLDDLLVHAADFEAALRNLRQVLEAIRQASLRLNPKKCSLLRREVKFLGHVVGAAGVATDPAKVEAVKDWAVPKNAQEVRSFLGLASYYRRFVHNFAHIASPLHRLTNKGQRFHWDDACMAAFSQLRDRLSSAPVLALPDPGCRFIVDTDASNLGVGAVLSQEVEAGEKVVAYYSRTLSRQERNYCVTRRELLAVIAALHHFRPYLYGQPFLLRTDHASLTWLLSFREPEGQVARWIEALQSYQFEIQHRPGHLHGNADALSRRPCEALDCRYCQRQEDRDRATPQVAVARAGSVGEELLEAITSQEWRTAQEGDPILEKVGQWVDAGKRPPWQDVSALAVEAKAYFSQWASLARHDGLLYRVWQTPNGKRKVWQLLVPKDWRQRVLKAVHGAVGAGHFGITKTLNRLRQRFYWAGCRQDTELFVHCCDACTAQKGPSRRSHAPLQQYQVGAPMERVGVDILGPFPTTDLGNRYVLVAMDYFTKWPEAYAVPDQSATTTAEWLVSEMFCRFGAPEELHSDQGRNFEAEVFAEVCQRMGVRKTRTTPLHPQSDGLVERFNRTLATQLAIVTSRHQRDWDRHLPLILWAYRSAVQESTGCTPAVLMFGRELRTPVDLAFGTPPDTDLSTEPGQQYLRDLKLRLAEVHDLARRQQAEAGVRQKRAYDSRCQGRPFSTGEKVWVYCPTRKKGVSPKLTSQWVGPCEVVEQLSDVVYRVKMSGRGRVVVLHRDRLAPYQPLAGGEEPAGDTGPSGTSPDSDPNPLDQPGTGVGAGRRSLESIRRPRRQRQFPRRYKDYVLS